MQVDRKSSTPDILQALWRQRAAQLGGVSNEALSSIAVTSRREAKLLVSIATMSLLSSANGNPLLAAGLLCIRGIQYFASSFQLYRQHDVPKNYVPYLALDRIVLSSPRASKFANAASKAIFLSDPEIQNNTLIKGDIEKVVDSVYPSRMPKRRARN